MPRYRSSSAPLGLTEVSTPHAFYAQNHITALLHEGDGHVDRDTLKSVTDQLLYALGKVEYELSIANGRTSGPDLGTIPIGHFYTHPSARLRLDVE